jgi:hypothetical protein
VITLSEDYIELALIFLGGYQACKADVRAKSNARKTLIIMKFFMRFISGDANI